MLASTVLWELDKRKRLLGPEYVVAEGVGLVYWNGSDLNVGGHGGDGGEARCWRLLGCKLRDGIESRRYQASEPGGDWPKPRSNAPRKAYRDTVPVARRMVPEGTSALR